MEKREIRLIALDLDGTLLRTDKSLSERNRLALEKAHEKGIHIVPTTGRFYGGIPQVVRELPFIRYCVTINGAEVVDLQENRVIYSATIPCGQAVEIMEKLDEFPALYDCYQENDSFMTASLREKALTTIRDVHFRNMVRDLRKPVEDLKTFLRERNRPLQKIQFFIHEPETRAYLMENLPLWFPHTCVTSSVEENVEINHEHAHKSAALCALAEHLGFTKNEILAFGDGENDISMLRDMGYGVAMANACQNALNATEYRTLSNDEDGVAHGIETFCNL